MAGEKHLLFTAQGSYSTPELSTETWQVGVRVALVFGSIDPAGTLPSNWDPVAFNVNRTETNWTIQGNWEVRAGASIWQPDDFLNDQVAPAFTTWMGQSAIAARARLDVIKCFPIGAPTGKAVPAPPYAQGTPMVLSWTANNPVGGGASGTLPLQNSIVASHRTSQPGRHGRGRMFLPAITPGVLDNNARILSSAQNAVRDAQLALLNALTYSDIAPGGPHLHSIVTGKPFTTYGVINRIVVDNLVDTQRRRRKSLVGTSVDVTVPM
jgi:hypothetical protein